MSELTALLPRHHAADSTDHSLQYLLLVLLLMMNMTTSIMGPFLPLQAQDMGISASRLGLIFGAPPLSCSLSSPLAGWACGRMGPASPLMASVLTLGCVNAGLAFLPALGPSPAIWFWALIVAAVVTGAGLAMGSASIMTSLALFYPKSIGKINGRVETCYGVGASCAYHTDRLTLSHSLTH